MSQNNRRIALLLIIVLTIIDVACSDFASLSGFFIGPHHAQTTAKTFAEDIVDVPPLLLRTSQCTTFIQTRSYWHEEYTPGVPFYRPLSLTVFWFEYHFLGPNHFERWMVVSIVLQILFCVLFAILVQNLTGSLPLALWTMIVFAGWRDFGVLGINQIFLSSTSAPALVAASTWKNQPTLFSDSLIVASMLFALRKKWIFGLISATAAVFFKESGWFAFLFVFMMLIWNDQLKAVPTWVYAAAVICIAIPLSARYFAGMGLIGGERLGSDQSWPMRYGGAVWGEYINCCVHAMWPSAATGTGLYFILRWRTSSLSLRLIGLIALLAVCSGINAIALGEPFAVGMVQLFSPSMQMFEVLACFIFTAGVAALIADKEMGRIAVQMVFYSLIAAASFASASQVSEHALNLCYAFQSAAVGAAWLAGFRIAQRYALGRMRWHPF